MNLEEKKDLLAEILEVETDEIVEDRNLESYDTWDSVAVLSLISVLNEKTGKYPHAEEIKKLQTIGDVLKKFDE